MLSTASAARPLARRRCAFWALLLAYLLLPLQALAATYTLPGSLPPGCSGSGPNYSCAAGSLPDNTVVVINSPKPATVTISGNLNVGSGTVINSAGSAGDLTLVVNGTLTLRYNSRVTANIQARAVSDPDGYATVTGSITSTSTSVTIGQYSSVSGSITSATTASLGYQASVGGNLTAGQQITLAQYASVGGNVYNTDGNLDMGYGSRIRGSADIDFTVILAQDARIDGNLTSRDDDITIGYAAIVGGTVRAQESISMAQNAAVGGLLSDTGDITVGYGAQVSGDVTTTNGTIDFSQDSVVQGCVRSVDSERITLGTNARIGTTCCGSATNGSCSRTCVTNNSGLTLPAACNSSTLPTSLAAYLFNEAGWAGAAGEVRDSAGSHHAQAAGLASTRPTVADASPALSGSTGTCGYGVFSRSNKQHVLLPTSFPNLGASGSFTVTAWFRTTDNTQSGQRIVADDENGNSSSAVGWLVSLGDRGTGMVNFVTRAAANAGEELVTGAVVSNNTWYHVAAGFNATTRSKFLRLTDASGTVLANLIAGVSASNLGTDSGQASIGGETNSATGGEASSSFGFAGNIDEVRVYGSVLSSTQIDQVRQLTSSCGGTLRASYDFDESSYSGTASEWRDGTGGYHGRGIGASMPTTATTSPARSGSPGTCRYASFAGPGANGPALLATGLPTTTTAGAKTTVAFWMKWDGSNDAIVLSFGTYSLWLYNSSFGFNTNAADVYGISSAGLSGTWTHVVAVFVNGAITTNELYINGVRQVLTQRTGTPNSANMVTGSSLQVSGYTADTYHRFLGQVDSVRVYNGAPSPSQVANLYAEMPTASCASGPARIRIEHASGSGLTCTPSTLTVRACSDAACTTNYTAGAVSGTLGSTGGSVAWPDGSSFSIAAGSSTTTVRVQSTSTTATVLGVASSTPTAANAATCNFGSPVCTFTAADAGFIFDVPHHRSDASQTVSVSAVRKSDNSLACTPAFASVTRSVVFSCSYTNPTSGTLPVRVGGTALNASGSTAAACDGGGRAVNLAFNASGVASTTVQYADVGQMGLVATYTGSAGTGDTGLTMTGSDSFIAAPDHFGFTGITAGPIKAGSSFGATVVARNVNATATPNFGRETSAQGAHTGFTRIQPTGSGAVRGSFSGSYGSFSSGAASATNLAWTEVGRGDLVARNSNSSGYLGSGMNVYGASTGVAVWCANENTSCVLPGGVTATVYYGENAAWYAKSGQSGTVACTNANFGDPLVGTRKKCFYVAGAATSGSVGDFIPHRFDVTATAACSSFTYAGQPFTATVTARNAAGATTVNFNGNTATTTPSFAQAVSLTEATALGVGSLASNTIAATAFSGGVASASPSYTFTSKQTVPQSLVLRATNGGSGAALISSLGGTEPTVALRSGRLRLANAFGSASSALQISAVAEYWASPGLWRQNSADSCTTVPASAVAISNKRSATGAASTASTSAGALSLSAGSGTLTLSAPTPSGSTLSLDLALNLGSTSTDQSCHANHPATTGASRAWLRGQFGSCAATADRDPGARASFGIFGAETRKTIHVRDQF